LNVEHLAACLSVVTGKDYDTISGYFQEIEEDTQLRDHLVRLTKSSKERHVADADIRFGRRIGWYALVRAIRPRVVVETGVDKGLGSCVFAAALMKNSAEGFPGRLIGTDINPNAGYLLQAPYDRFGKVVYGDSLATLKNLNEEVDLFIHDSVHTAEYEHAEFLAVQPKLSKNAVVLSDNSHVTDRLLVWAQQNGRDFLFFGDKPKNHWYAGDGIGIAFNRLRRASDTTQQ
jgi:predicted O-methyltransferase YrrM